MKSAARVVTVEDDPDQQMLIRDGLSPRFEVLPLARGEGLAAGIAALAPDAILLDYDLGGFTGAQLCRELRGFPATARTPILFYTGLRDEAAFADLRAAGADALILKPLLPSSLAGRVTEAIDAARR